MEKACLKLKPLLQILRVCSFWRIQERIFDPRLAGFRVRKKREI